MQNNSIQTNNEGLDILNLLKKVLRLWPYLIGSVLICLAIAFLYIRYSPVVYSVEASVLVKNVSNLSISNILFDEEDFGSGNREMSNEILVLRSYPLIQETVEDLNLRISTFRTTSALNRMIEVYGAASPYIIKAIESDSNGRARLPLIHISREESGALELKDAESDEFLLNLGLGDTVEINGLDLFIGENRGYDGRYSLEDEFFFSVNSVESVVRSYRNRLSALIEEKDATVIQVKLDATVVEKELDFLESLIEKYKARNLREKNQASTNSIEFIDKELAVITDSLRRIESRLEYFKSDRKIASLDEEGHGVLERLMELDAKQAELTLQKKYFDYIADYLDEYSGQEVLIHPASFGVLDEYLGNIASKVIALETRKQRLESGGNVTETTILIELNKELKQLRESISKYVEQLKKTNQIQLTDIKSRIGILESSIKGLSSSEIQLMNINRLHELSESLFLLLMEKKAEAQILRSANTPDYVVINPPRLSDTRPISPQKRIIYSLAIILGLILPTLFIVVKSVIDDKIYTKEDLVAIDEAPFLGEVYSATSEDGAIAIHNKPKSRISESFRTIRANLSFIRSERKRVFTVTSLLPGEGKTFISAGLAASLAGGKHSVVVVGADMRKPRLHEEFGLANQRGLSNYLVNDDDSISIDDVLQPTGLGSLYVISSGPVPPNPLELLEEASFSDLLEKLLDRFDYVVIDTPPFGLVSDALEVFKHADTNLIAIRSGVSKLRSIEDVNDLITKRSSLSFGLVLNDVKTSNGYGRYGKSDAYGYGYYTA